MGLMGTMHTATIAERVGGEWTAIAATWTCRLQAMSPTTFLRGSQYLQTTHIAIGEPTPVIDVGMRLTIDGVNYYVNGSQMHEKPGVGPHHQEVYLVRAEAL